MSKPTAAQIAIDASSTTTPTYHCGVAARRQPSSPARRHRERQPRAQGEDVAVGEVDELQDAVDEGVAQGDQRVEAADGDAVDQGLEKCVEEAWPQVSNGLPVHFG